MFINISNHPSSKWSQKQLEAAQNLAGDNVVVDMPFPNIDPNASTDDVYAIAQEMMNSLLDQITSTPVVVMLQGEFSLCYMMAPMITRQFGCYLVVACTERAVVENTRHDGSVEKTSTFEFCQFRMIP